MVFLRLTFVVFRVVLSCICLTFIVDFEVFLGSWRWQTACPSLCCLCILWHYSGSATDFIHICVSCDPGLLVRVSLVDRTSVSPWRCDPDCTARPNSGSNALDLRFVACPLTNLQRHRYSFLHLYRPRVMENAASNAISVFCGLQITDMHSAWTVVPPICP